MKNNIMKKTITLFIGLCIIIVCNAQLPPSLARGIGKTITSPKYYRNILKINHITYTTNINAFKYYDCRNNNERLFHIAHNTFKAVSDSTKWQTPMNIYIPHRHALSTDSVTIYCKFAEKRLSNAQYMIDSMTLLSR